MNFLETCTGYACPPGNKVPAGDVIVRTVHDTLASIILELLEGERD